MRSDDFRWGNDGWKKRYPPNFWRCILFWICILDFIHVFLIKVLAVSKVLATWSWFCSCFTDDFRWICSESHILGKLYTKTKISVSRSRPKRKPSSSKPWECIEFWVNLQWVFTFTMFQFVWKRFAFPSQERKRPGNTIFHFTEIIAVSSPKVPLVATTTGNCLLFFLKPQAERISIENVAGIVKQSN